MRASTRIITLLASSNARYTVAAIEASLESPKVWRSTIQTALDDLIETGAVKNDPWKHGYCYRHANVSPDADVWHVVMRPSLERANILSDKTPTKRGEEVG